MQSQEHEHRVKRHAFVAVQEATAARSFGQFSKGLAEPIELFARGLLERIDGFHNPIQRPFHGFATGRDHLFQYLPDLLPQFGRFGHGYRIQRSEAG